MIEIFSRIQNRFGMPISTTIPLAGLSGDTLNNGTNPEDLILWGNLPLPSLDGLSFLPSFPELTDPGLSVYPPWHEPQGILGVRV